MKDDTNLNDKTSASQAKMILAYMKEGNRITGLDALVHFNCFRLPARIADLRAEGHDIKSEFVTTDSGKHVKAYWI